VISLVQKRIQKNWVPFFHEQQSAPESIEAHTKTTSEPIQRAKQLSDYGPQPCASFCVAPGFSCLEQYFFVTKLNIPLKWKNEKFTKIFKKLCINTGNKIQKCVGPQKFCRHFPPKNASETSEPGLWLSFAYR